MVVAAALVIATSTVVAHPGSGIVVDSQGHVYFMDTGRGVWKLDRQGRLTLLFTAAYHWAALDEKGHFARSGALGNFDRGSFERVSLAGAVPGLIVSSDYPIVTGNDGALYYVPFSAGGPRELIRRLPNGQRSVFALLPSDAGPKPMQWVNGITAGPDGVLYVTDNDAVRRIGRNGAVSTFRESFKLAECADPLPDTPKLPYLRGLAVASDGTVYAAASGCRAVIAIPAKGPVQILLKAERPWSPTGVAVFGRDIYVLEYIHTSGDNRKEWIPRIRRIAPDGTITTLATVQRR